MAKNKVGSDVESPKIAGESYKRTILLTRFSALGDVAISIPQIYVACAANPEVRFVMVTRPHPASMFINTPGNLYVESVDLKRYSGMLGLKKLFDELYAKYHPDTLVDLHDVMRTRVLSLFARIKGVRVHRLRKGRGGKRALTRRNRKVLLPLTPTHERYREALHAAGLKTDATFHTLYPAGVPTEAFASATPPKQPGEYWIAIAPFAKHAGKIYPTDKMEEIIAHYSARPGVKIFVMGYGDTETEIIEEWHRCYPGVVNMARLNIGLPAEMALLAYCDVMLSMDSANMHLASLVGLRTVSIWGATHPFCGFMGWNQRAEDAVQLDMTCRPCSVFGNKPCHRGDYHCLNGINPQIIIDRIDRNDDK